MKNLKFYWLILLIAFAVSFALPANAQAKKVRKKAKVVKKKVARKIAAPKMAVKIGEEDLSSTSDGPVKIGSDNYTPTGSGGGQGSPTTNRPVKVGKNNTVPCEIKSGPVGIIGGSNDNLTTPTENDQQAGGVVNGKASILPKPPYTAAAKAVRASGTVSVQVLIDEEGNVVSANATSGHPLLRAASEKAAREAKFYPTELCGQRVKVSGIIVYNFVAQ
jgi:TonB family protein